MPIMELSRIFLVERKGIGNKSVNPFTACPGSKIAQVQSVIRVALRYCGEAAAHTAVIMATAAMYASPWVGEAGEVSAVLANDVVLLLRDICTKLLRNESLECDRRFCILPQNDEGYLAPAGLC